jgi:hypothetical protein
MNKSEMKLSNIYYLNIILSLLDSQDKNSYELRFNNILNDIETNFHEYFSSKGTFYPYKFEVNHTTQPDFIYANMYFKHTNAHKIVFDSSKLIKVILNHFNNNVRVSFNEYYFNI